MFKKLWKTLKFFLVTGIILICLPHSILPKKAEDLRKDDLEYYSRLNDSEKRLKEYKDGEEALKLKIRQLEVINASRRKHNAGHVKLDILASRVANRMCREAAENGFLGHYNLAGEKPYHRYAFAGGYDHISENAYGEWTTGTYDVKGSVIFSMMNKGHSTFMSEKPPYDGHKKNVINKSHNFVGIGYYLSGKQFRYYEEFIDRKFEFENIPPEVKTDEPFTITVRTSGDSYLYYLVAYREELPERMDPATISKKGSYSDFTDEQHILIPAWDLARMRNGSVFTIPLKFSLPGLYYIQIFEDKKEISGHGSVNTSGKTPFSGIVIRAR